MTAADADAPARGTETLHKVVDATRRLGEQTAFYGNALAATADAVRRYPSEVLRLIAVMGMGTGALAVIGGTVVIIGFLTLSTGALIAVQGYNTLADIERLLAAFGAVVDVLVRPGGIGVGCRAGAKAMRQGCSNGAKAAQLGGPHDGEARRGHLRKCTH